MKKVFAVMACGALALCSQGCAGNKSRAVEGAVIGGILGAGVGGITGHQMHRGAEGAGIGAAAGAIGGALIGAQIPNPQNQQGQQAAGQGAVNPNQMSLQQVADLARQGANEDVIIDKIRLSNSRYTLSQGDMDYLRQQGVSQKVIAAMQGY